MSGLRLWCLHRSPSLVLGLTTRSLGRSLSGNARVSIQLLRVRRILGGGKIRQTRCVLSLAKFLNKKSFYLTAVAKKFLKGVLFLLGRVCPACNLIRSCRWEAESFVVAEVVCYNPPTQQSQSGGFSQLRCLPHRPLCACFPLKRFSK